ncbi:MAG: carbamate kinase, partial [Candidatus Latescibacteria bacterium]|nr:carbamate kinase [bacterium]MBD3425541.1 carbamate kinase [Candidatus Latescibacterota bacterium]
AVGGGGIPVIRKGEYLHGVEAVIDKDRAASVLADNVGADRLFMLTNVDYVYTDYGMETQEPIKSIPASELRARYSKYEFPAGSMGPKVRAALDFVENGGEMAVITGTSDLLDACRSEKGTRVLPG